MSKEKTQTEIQKPDTIESYYDSQKGEIPDIPLPFLESYKPAKDLPKDFNSELMAAELLEHRSTFVKADIAWRSARRTDKQRETAMWNLRNFAHTAAATIVYLWRETEQLSNEIARARVVKVKQERESLLSQESEADLGGSNTQTEI